MAAANFNPLVQQLLGIEGGVADRSLKDDPGGLTNKGVTQATYDAWRTLKGLQPKSVRQIQVQEVIAIARANYWQPIQGDKLPSGVDFTVFDFAFNSGAAQAVKELQRTLGCAADGVVGLATLEALAVADERAVINGVCDRRWTFMKRLKNFKANENGWRNRVAHVRAQSLALAAGDAAEAPDASLTSMPLAKAPPAAVKKPNVLQRAWIGIGLLVTAAMQWITDHVNAAVSWVSAHLPLVSDGAAKIQSVILPQATNSAVVAKLASALAVIVAGAGAALILLQLKPKEPHT